MAEINDNYPWVWVNEFSYFYVNSMGWLLEHLYNKLMEKKNISYDAAVQYVYDNCYFVHKKVQDREVFRLAQDEGWEAMIRDSVTGGRGGEQPEGIQPGQIKEGEY